MTSSLLAASRGTRPLTRSVLSARGLARSFGAGDNAVRAVQGLDLDIAEGEVVAFLGPNGAGKTTSLRMLTTLLLAVTAIGIGALSYALALAVRSQEWMFWTVQQTLLFPLLLLAGVLLPLESGPGWMRAAAAANPLHYLVDAERALFAGDVLNSTVLAGAVAAACTAALGVWIGTRAMRAAS